MANSVVQEEFNLAARKVSFAPMNRSLNMQTRSFSWRNGSFPLFRDNVTLADGSFLIAFLDIVTNFQCHAFHYNAFISSPIPNTYCFFCIKCKGFDNLFVKFRREHQQYQCG